MRVADGAAIDTAVATIAANTRGDLTPTARRIDPVWLGQRLLEGDEVALARVDAAIAEVPRSAAEAFTREHGVEPGVVLADDRYDLARQIAAEVVTRPNTTVGRLSDRIDRVLIHRFWGVPIFLGVMYLMFMFTINLGGAFIDVFDGIAGATFVDGARWLLEAISAPSG